MMKLLKSLFLVLFLPALIFFGFMEKQYPKVEAIYRQDVNGQQFEYIILSKCCSRIDPEVFRDFMVDYNQKNPMDEKNTWIARSYLINGFGLKTIFKKFNKIDHSNGVDLEDFGTKIGAYEMALYMYDQKSYEKKYEARYAIYLDKLYVYYWQENTQAWIEKVY